MSDSCPKETQTTSSEKIGRPRRFATGADLPFEDYVKIYNHEYYLLRKHTNTNKRKVGRPRVCDLDKEGFMITNDGLFSCSFCGSTFKLRPQRHLQGVKCRLARLESGSQPTG